MQSLISLQEETISRMLEPRTSQARVERNQSRAVRRYRKAQEKAGYTTEQINAQVRDIWDMYRLYRDAE